MLDHHHERQHDVPRRRGQSVRLLLAFRTEQTAPEAYYAALGPPEDGSIAASATNMPIASGTVDVCFSSNVLEHVRDWPAMLAEMVRVTRPGGIVFVAFTNWLSPYGRHETSPCHYLGGERAAAWYQRKHGRQPKNLFGHSLHQVSVAEALG